MDFDNIPGIDKKEIEDLGKSLCESIIRSEIGEGNLELNGLSEHESKVKALAHLEKITKNDSITHKVIIHTDTILNEAENYRKQGKDELALLLYGTWWEHWLNGVIETRSIHEGLDDNDFKDIVRTLNNHSKSSWLFKLLKLPPLENKHLKTMQSLATKRNQFVHYKYAKVELDSEEQSSKDLFVRIEEAIMYFTEFEDKNIYGSFSFDKKI